jgi:hypothetical protein
MGSSLKSYTVDKGTAGVHALTRRRPNAAISISPNRSIE